MSRVWREFLLAAAGATVLDLGSKWIVERTVSPFSRVVLVDGFFNLTNVRNPGAAFGIFSDGGFGRIAFFVTLTLFAMAFMLWLVRRIRPENRLEPLALGLIFGGAAGNLVDRIRYGEVVDFLLVFWRDHYWPAFNIADSTICVGILLFLLSDLKKNRQA